MQDFLFKTVNSFLVLSLSTLTNMVSHESPSLYYQQVADTYWRQFLSFTSRFGAVFVTHADVSKIVGATARNRHLMGVHLEMIFHPCITHHPVDSGSRDTF